MKVAAGPLVTNLVATGMNPEEYTTNVIQQSSSYTYSASGQALMVENALGETTVATNDALGRVILERHLRFEQRHTVARDQHPVDPPDHHSATAWQGSGGRRYCLDHVHRPRKAIRC